MIQNRCVKSLWQFPSKITNNRTTIATNRGVAKKQSSQCYQIVHSTTNTSKFCVASFHTINSHLRNTLFDKPIRILSIETSCDDTGVAILESTFRKIQKPSPIQHEQTSSPQESSCIENINTENIMERPTILHEQVITHHELVNQYGGVHPTEMAQMHRATLDGMIENALEKVSNLDSNREKIVDYVAVTVGPGLPPCLSAGLDTAMKYCEKLNVPVIPVHHLEAHLLVPLMFSENTSFPYLVLLASGGHCLVVFSRGIGQYEIVGGTEDDSIGEAFDKTARLLQESIDFNLNDYVNEKFGTRENYSGGALVEKLALLGDSASYNFPIPLRKGTRRNDITFSFSGIKTDVLRTVRKEQNQGISKRDLHHLLNRLRNNGSVKNIQDINASLQTPVDPYSREGSQLSTIELKNEKLSEDTVCNISASFQKCAFTHLIEKLELAMHRYRANVDEYPNSLIVSGGVSANQYFRHELTKLSEKYEYNLKVAPMKYCTDNAVMIGYAAFQRLFNECHKPVEVCDKERYIPRWPITTLSDFYTYNK